MTTHVFHRSTRARPPTVVAGHGIELIAADGRCFIDACGGAAVSCLGHGHPVVTRAIAQQAASMAYALPGAVIAVGVLIPLAWLDRVLGDAAAWTLGRSAGLVLTGSIVGLLFAYVVRFLSVSLQTMESSLAKIPTTFDDAARSLGTSIGGTLRRIHLPLMRGGVLTAVILVFVETMKEMPATLLLRPLGFDTLAVAVWERTSESLWADAAAPALAIVVAGLVPVLAAIRLSADRR